VNSGLKTNSELVVKERDLARSRMGHHSIAAAKRRTNERISETGKRY